MQDRAIVSSNGVLVTTTFDGVTGNYSVSNSGNRITHSSFLDVLADVTTGNHNEPHPHYYKKYEADYVVQQYRNESTVKSAKGYSWQSAIGDSTHSPVAPVGSVYGSFSTTAYNKALDSLYEQVRGNLDLAIDLLERESTVKMVKPCVKIAEGFVNVVNKIRKIKKHPFSAVDEASNAWLQYTYGIKPLISSMYGFLDAFNNPRRGRIKCSGRATEHVKSFQYTGSGYDKTTYQVEDSSRCQHVIWMNLHPDFLTDFGSLSSMNPASIAWELIPYSFVVDWVIDIGGYLRMLESAVMYQRFFEAGYTTQTSRRSVECTQNGSQKVGTNIYSITSHGHVTGSAKSRVVISTPPFPHPPVVDCHLGWQRVASAASLMWNATRQHGFANRRTHGPTYW